MKTEKKNAFGLKTTGEEFAPPTEIPRSQLLAHRKLLLAEKGDPIIKKAIDIALNDEHPGQVTAIKMLVDRLLPLSEFEAVKGGTRNQVTITISGVGDTKVDSNDNVVDAEDV